MPVSVCVHVCALHEGDSKKWQAVCYALMVSSVKCVETHHRVSFTLSVYGVIQNYCSCQIWSL